MMKQSLLFNALLLITSLTIGCAHGNIKSLDGQSSVDGKISRVTVTIEGVVPDRLQVYQSLDGNSLIERDVTAAVRAAGRYDAGGDVELKIVVTNFRLRSTGNAFWAGIYGGVDKLGGNVEFRSAGASPQSYSFALSGSEDWLFKFDRVDRLDSLARLLGKKVVSTLKK